MSDAKHDPKEGRPRVPPATTVPDTPRPGAAGVTSQAPGSTRASAQRLASDLFLDEDLGGTEVDYELPTRQAMRSIPDPSDLTPPVPQPAQKEPQASAKPAPPPVRVSTGPATSYSTPPPSLAASFEPVRSPRRPPITTIPLSRPIVPPPAETVVDPPRFPEHWAEHAEPAAAAPLAPPSRPQAPPAAPARPPRAGEPLFAALLFPEQHRAEPPPPARHEIEPAAPSPEVPSEIRVALPASVLIVDDDTRAASAVAARLLEYGYTCRVSRADGAKAALAKEHFDAVVFEIPAEEARKTLGKERLRALAEFNGPAIVTSAAVMRLDLLRDTRQVHAVLTKPYFIEVLVQSIEAARTPTTGDFSDALKRRSPAPAAHAPPPFEPAPPAVAPSPPRLPAKESAPAVGLAPAERRSAHRYELDANVVRVVITGPGGQNSRGRVRNLSNNGGMLIDTAIRLPIKAPVTAELTLFDGRMMIFTGRVVRTISNDLAIRFQVDDAQHAFLDLFLAEARTPNQRAIQPIRLSMREQGTTEDIIDDMSLMKRWLEVSDRLDEDDIQQRFIQDCLKAERIEFALGRYRELKAQRPNDERVAKYIQQIGTILSFYAFKKEPAAEQQTKMPASLKIVIGIFILAGIALLLILRRAMR